jgi:hypothetical protein
MTLVATAPVRPLSRRYPWVTGPTSFGRKPYWFFCVMSSSIRFQKVRYFCGSLGYAACRKSDAERCANPSLIHWSRYEFQPTACPHHRCATSWEATDSQ